MACETPEIPDRPAMASKRHIKRERCTPNGKGSLTHEEKLKSLEETRQAALEVAQEEDEKKEEGSEAAEEVDSLMPTTRGYGVTWYPYGLQLWE